MFSSVGNLEFRLFDKYELVRVMIDDEIVNYYRSLLPKWIKANRSRHQPHISVIRNEVIPNQNKWNHLKKSYPYWIEINFEYDNFIYEDGTYFWLQVRAPALERFRTDLGLPAHSAITRSPDGQHDFHITLGNKKNL